MIDSKDGTIAADNFRTHLTMPTQSDRTLHMAFKRDPKIGLGDSTSDRATYCVPHHHLGTTAEDGGVLWIQLCKPVEQLRDNPDVTLPTVVCRRRICGVGTSHVLVRMGRSITVHCKFDFKTSVAPSGVFVLIKKRLGITSTV